MCIGHVLRDLLIKENMELCVNGNTFASIPNLLGIQEFSLKKKFTSVCLLVYLEPELSLHVALLHRYE